MNSPRRVDLDLGDGHTLRFLEWDPDPDLNPQYADLPPEEFHHGAIIGHVRSDGSYCEGVITFDTPRARRGWAGHPMWTVESRDPLTLSPSLLCTAPRFGPDNKPIAGTECGDHGFIRGGRWVRA